MTDSTSEPICSTGFLSGFRQVLDPVLCLLIAVLLVRTFLVQGYLISTGSMAPHYYGTQKRATCPDCQFHFAIGTEFEGDSSSSRAEVAICPNCFSDRAELTDLEINRGDHLLVWKNAYQFRMPTRGEIVVFRNPNDPLETYIKRIAGLPGERIQIRDGEIWINGELERKPLELQRALKIPVYDTDFEPIDSEIWQPRWSATEGNSGWSKTESSWSFEPGKTNEDWLTYQHTLQFGGTHETFLTLTDEELPTIRNTFREQRETFPFTPEPKFPQVRLEEDRLIATGVIPLATRRRLRTLLATTDFQERLTAWFAKSHAAPVTDFTAYNHEMINSPQQPVTDFMLEATIEAFDARGTIEIDFWTVAGWHRFRIDGNQSTVSLSKRGDEKPVSQITIKLPAKSAWKMEFSSFDRQLLIALDGNLLLPPYRLEPDSAPEPQTGEIVRFSGNTPYTLRHLRLFRDVVYTDGTMEHGATSPYVIPEDHYFVLGDNSRVSSDSRRWERATVPHKLLVGKPLLVHLPSTRERIGWGTWKIPYRRPDFSRIRFVR